MEDLWNQAEINIFLAKNKKNKKNDKKGPYVDPIHDFTDNTHKYLPGGNPNGPNKMDKAMQFGGKCKECGNFSPNSKIEENLGLCKTCRKNPNIIEKYNVTCKNCSDPIEDRSDHPNSDFCKDCRKNCENCEDEIEDQSDNPDSDFCKDCRKDCENCGGPIEDQSDNPDSNFCENCRKYCENCYDEIEDRSDHPNSDFCENCRKNCENCEDEIEDQSDYPNSDFCENCRKICENCYDEIEDQSDYPDSDFCQDCRKYCENCGGPIEDQSDNPDSDFCENCRKNCENCGDEIEDPSDYPNSDFCENCRGPDCKEKTCPNAVEDQDTEDYQKDAQKIDKDGDPLTAYCPDCRHRCRICNDKISNQTYNMLKKESDEALSPVVPITKALEIGTHPSDKSSMQYLDAKNPDYFTYDKKPGKDWYNICNSCRDYIKLDWK